MQRRFLEFSRALHPDKFVRDSEAIRSASLDRMGLLNEAYRVLRDRDSLREFLVASAGLSVSASKSPDDLKLAERWFEIQEALMDLDDPVRASEQVRSFFSEVSASLEVSRAQMRELEQEHDRLMSLQDRRGAQECLGRMQALGLRRNTFESLERDVMRLMARVGMS